MRRKLFLFTLVVVSATTVFAQTQFEVSQDKNGGKILKGIISRNLLQNDTSFHWYAENEKNYTPNPTTVAAFKKNADSIQIIVFMGTWCDDSHFIVPKFYSLIDAAGFSNDRVTIIGVDRQKKTISHLTEALDVKNVPTIIVMKNGVEQGRVVEYGKYGVFDKDLGEIINAIK